MSEAFLSDLQLPVPHHQLGVGSGTHGEQTARVLLAYESLCMREPPHWTVVVGDVNSTLAATLAAKKLGLPVAHLEAGLRSGDRDMPEEINRIVTDSISDLLWAPSQDAVDNLRREGVAQERIELVGNIMIDAFEMLRPAILAAGTAEELGMGGQAYGVVTLHRPRNVDDPAILREIVLRLGAIAERLPLVFPVHPRTQDRLDRAGLLEGLRLTPGLNVTRPLNYIRFMSLVQSSRLAITDSGGIQEETSYLGIPCLTLRPNTERPVTLTHCTNSLTSLDALERDVDRILRGDWKPGQSIPLWDGGTAARVVDSLRSALMIDSGGA
jgi:UDP-N-acetylglucosamine 2-epimerase (non-hydrolysing)